MNKSQLIFIPSPGIGHVVSMIEFAKVLIKHNDQLTITILVMKPPSAPYLDAYVQSLIVSQSNIKLIDLPNVDLPPIELFKTNPETYNGELPERYKPSISDIINNISIVGSESNPVLGIVLDFFCAILIDVGNELGIPSFLYLATGCACLNLTLYLPSWHEKNGHHFSFSDSDVVIPGFVDSVPVSVLPGSLFNPIGYGADMKVAQRFKDADGILVNTVAELEPYALEYLNKPDSPNPPVYPVGPVLDFNAHPHPDMDKAKWGNNMKWLDEQPEKSVVFLCFGSAGWFTVEQVKELALGLEQSGHKFVWSLRVPPSEKFENPEEMLPEGFLERVSGRGIVCGWAPQVEVLAHKAIGGFVSHCGWNSFMESLWFGVPIITWPIYAEQQLNAYKLVKELELAVELKSDYRRDRDLIKAAEVEKAVKCLMENATEVKMKFGNMAEIARKAVTEGGSSFNSIQKFFNDLKSYKS